VSKIVQQESTRVRKPEKKTGPKIFYVGAEDSVIQPEVAVRPLYFKEGQVHLRPIGSPDPDLASPGDPRVDYDTPHKKPWGVDMVIYLFAKAVSTGVMLLASVLWLLGDRTPLVAVAAPIVSIVFITLTTIVLIVDLERPERFYYILTRSNWRSWLVWGTWFLAAHGTISGVWLVSGWMGWERVITALAPPALVAALLATSYTGFLFEQGRGRDLWQGRHAAIDLIAQSGTAGAATLILTGMLFGVGDVKNEALVLGGGLTLSVLAHLVMLVFENMVKRSPTRHHELAVQTIREGAYARLFWGVAIGAGGVAPLLLMALLLVGREPTGAVALVASLITACVLALAGSAAWDYIWVEAGQSVPLS
jgi:formate-dependent nitrite reductase membrane component NrfD